MNHDHDPAWRGVVVVLACLLTASAAHAAAGGGSPGPGGLAVLVLLLAPVAVIVRRIAGPAGLLLAGAVGQVVGHVGLGIVTASGAGAGTGTGTGTAGGAAAQASAHHAGHSHADAGALSASMDAAGGWDSLTGPVLHLLHMGPAMIAAHALAVLVTAVLVTAVTDAVRRIAHRFVALLRAIVLPETPYPVTRPRSVPASPTAAPLLLVRPLRGPPLHT